MAESVPGAGPPKAVEWLKAGPVENFPPGGTRVKVKGREVAVFRIGDDFYALGDRCSHAEASLAEGEVFDHEVECPLHGAGFDLRTGQHLSLPATRPVPSYQVRIEDGMAMIGLQEEEE